MVPGARRGIRRILRLQEQSSQLSPLLVAAESNSTPLRGFAALNPPVPRLPQEWGLLKGEPAPP